MNEILLNPGPTNTLSEVKETQTKYSDICHRTDDFLNILKETKALLLYRFSPFAKKEDWNVSLFGGSGTAAMEALVSSLISKTNVLIAGKYGKRASEMMQVYNVESMQYFVNTAADLKSIDMSPAPPNLYFVENETTTGEKFSLRQITKHFPKKRLYIDATSAFGATDYTDFLKHIDAISFCSNKCLQSTPGLGIVIWKKTLSTISRNYYLNLQKYNSKDLPFTLPVQSVAALRCALKESYTTELLMDIRKNKIIRDLAKYKIKCINHEPCNTIIGFTHPTKTYEELKDFLKKRNIIIYDGIENIENSFRIATMSVDFDRYYDYISNCFKESTE